MIVGHDNYQGPERRRYRCFKTRNSEYHCRDNVCVAVRNLRTGDFVPDHRAIGKRMSSAIRFSDGGGIAEITQPDQVRVGEQLCFSSGQRVEEDIITSELKAIERPPKELVNLYPLN